MGLPFLVVRVCGRLCGLPLAPGMETMRRPAATGGREDVPGLLGMTMLRGDLVAVLDLGVLLGLGAGEPGGRMVSVKVGERCVGLAVEEVLGVRTLEPEALTAIALPDGGQGAGGNDRRMGRFDEGFAQLVEAAGLLPEALWGAVDDAAAAVAA